MQSYTHFTLEERESLVHLQEKQAKRMKRIGAEATAKSGVKHVELQKVLKEPSTDRHIYETRN